MGVGTKCRECRGMQGDARGTYGPGKCMGVGTKCQGNGGQERSVMQENAKEHIEVGAKCQWNARECKGMQGNARGMYWSGCKVPVKCREMQWNAIATYGSGCKVPGNAGECRGMPGKHMGMGAKCHGNAGECKKMHSNVWEWVQSTSGMQGNAGECHGNVWEWVQSAREMHGSVCKVQWKCRGTPGECMGVGAKHQRNTGECRVMRGERMEVGATVHCCMPLYITAYTIAHHCKYY